MSRKLLLFLLFFNLQELCIASMSDMVYYDFPSENYRMCYRRFNSTHQFGCSTSEKGETGFVHLINSPSDVDWLEQQRGEGMRFVVVIDINLSHFKNSMGSIMGLGKSLIAGVLINYSTPINHTINPYSPDLPSPNYQQSIYPAPPTIWNPASNNLLFVDLPFPVAMITDEYDVQQLVNCHVRGNVERNSTQSKVHCPYCAVNMRSVMTAASNSRICFRRNYAPVRRILMEGICDPLGNHNILSPLGPWPLAPVNKVTMVVARMDTTSLFESTAPGIGSTITAITTLYAVMEVLKKEEAKLQTKPNHTLLFVLFNGETFNYMGSTKLAHDLTLEPPYMDPLAGEDDADDSGEFFKNIKIANIDTMIELGHLFHPAEYTPTSQESAPLYLHYHDNPNINTILDKFTSQSIANITITPTTTKKLPPSSLHPFLRKNPDVKAIYLSNYENEFVSRFYNGFLDNIEQFSWYDNINPQQEAQLKTKTTSYIASTATIVSCAVYKHLTNSADCAGIATADEAFVARLMYCFARNVSCDLFSELLMTDSDMLKKHFPNLDNHYVQVMEPRKVTNNVLLHNMLFVRTLGDLVSEDVCTKAEKNDTFIVYSRANSGGKEVCYRHHTYDHKVYPTNLKFDASDISIDELHPGWAESSWGSAPFSIKVFMVPCRKQELKTLLLGTVVVVVTLVVTMFTKLVLLRNIV